MKRRAFLASAGATAAASSFPAPAIAQGIRELKLVSSFPLSPGTKRLAQLITETSGGRLKVKAFGAGELVSAFEVFDAVSEGIADMYFSAEYYWSDRSPAFNFFATVPFGLTAGEMITWIYRGGGQELWDELSANFNLKAFHCGVEEIQMGGWYNKEITSIETFKGLRIRIPGLGGEVMRRLGAIPVTLAAGEIVPALRSGALDAAEFVGPGPDLRLGLHAVGKYYYYPGVHEPGQVNSLGINLRLWHGLNGEERKLIDTAIAAFNGRYHANAVAEDMNALAILIERHGALLRKFDDGILRAFGKASGEVVAEVGASDAFTRRVYQSYMKFHKASRQWSDTHERAYLNARALEFPYGN